MVRISANIGHIEIIKTTKNLEVNKSHQKIFKDHFSTCPKTYTKVEGVIWDSSQDLSIDVIFSNAKKADKYSLL
ncbi:hypothetical protein LCGC14_1814530 [marine sediment metagenome]|uniref:Uncharacterized protein n=1 Tax=marine sediment metagenome TaxID=412755 RepID=A0A0F9H8W3_9ZZZZ